MKNLFLFITLLLLITVPQTSKSIIQLSKNSDDNYYPSAYETEVAWQISSLSSSSSIVYWNGNTTTNVTGDFSFAGSPSLYNGTIAWFGNKEAYEAWNIFYWDGNQTHQITNNGSQSSPSLFNGTIAWVGDDDANDLNNEIFYWNGTDIQQISTNPYLDDLPSLYNGTIAWASSNSEGRATIKYWNGTSKINISADTMDTRCPSLYNGTIAYSGHPVDDYSESSIYFWNGMNIQHISPTGDNIGCPSLYNGKIAYVYNDNQEQSYKLMYWNGSSNILITENNSIVHHPSLSSDILVWSEMVDNSMETFTISTKNPTAIAGDDKKVSLGQSLTLDGSKSFDLDGTISNWAWQLIHETNTANNHSYTGKQITTSDLSSGKYLGTLTITDNDGRTGSDTFTIRVDGNITSFLPAILSAARSQIFHAGLFLYPGNWSGTFSGNSSGTWVVNISAEGNVSGTGVSKLGHFSIEGNVGTNGNFNAETFSIDGSVTGGSKYTGHIVAPGIVTGTWNNNYYPSESGIFSGNLEGIYP